MGYGFIWDIDGVVMDSPHEAAWRETASKPPWSVSLSTDFYLRHVASRPRYEGAHNILLLQGVYDKLGAKTEEERKRLLERFATEKNNMIRDLIRRGKFKIFRDAVTLLLRAKRVEIPQACASASKNATDMLRMVDRERILRMLGTDYGVLSPGQTLYDMFDVDACGLDLGGKTGILRHAADQLRAKFPEAEFFVVFEDSPSGLAAAKSLGFYAVGVHRIGSVEALRDAGADIIVDRLDELNPESLLREIEAKNRESKH